MTSTTAVQPRLGHLIGGHVLVAYTAGEDAIVTPWGTGLLVSSDASSSHRYVVWTLFHRGDRWYADRADYCLSLANAIEAYVERGGDLTAVNS